MIDQFVGFCLHRRVAIIIIAVLLSAFGVYAWETLSVEAYPELGDVAAQVTTQIPGLAAEEVEQLITVPLERQINGTPGLLLMRSSSTFGLSLITVLFRDGYEDYWARQRLTERINQAVLPAGATPSLDPVAGPGGEIYRYTLESNTKNLQELSEIQRWIVIPALKSVPGVVDDTQLRRLHHRVSAQPRSETADALLPRHHRRDQRHQQQQHERGRRPRVARRPELRDPRRRPDPQSRGDRLHRRHAGERRAGAGARPRAHHAEPPGARRHPRKGFQSRHDRGHRADAQVPESLADPARRPREGQSAECQARGERRTDRAVHRSGRSGARHHPQGRSDHPRRDHARLPDLDPVPRQPEERRGRRGQHSSRAGVGIFAVESHPRVREPPVARRHRLRHPGRRRHRRDRGGTAPARGDAQRGAERERGQGRHAPGHPPDLLCEPHHHHRLPAAILVRARRGQAVHADGLHHGLCAVWRVADGAGARAGACLSSHSANPAAFTTTAGSSA